MDLEHFKEKIGFYPEDPGVYLMRDKEGKILYIGKAKNLKNRLKNYLFLQDSRAMVPHLLARLAHIETIVVSSEREALILEQKLIQKNHPPFNAMLKDDRSQLVLSLSKEDPYPALLLLRAKLVKKKTKSHLFGPYTDAFRARRMVDEVKRFFRLRSCSDREFVARKKPCILYQMQRCLAPCVGLCSEEVYQREVNSVVQFLKGDYTLVLDKIREQIEEASSTQSYERALYLKKGFEAVQKTLEEKKLFFNNNKAQDVWGFYRIGDVLCVALLLFKEGFISSQKTFFCREVLEEDGEQVESLIYQYYCQNPHDLPHKILLPQGFPAFSIEIEEGWSIECSKTASRGKEWEVSLVAEKNARAALERYLSGYEEYNRILGELQKMLSLKNFPAEVECFDISHTAGKETVGALVRFSEGREERSKRRLYKMRQEHNSSDIDAMREMLERRLKKINEEEDPPALLLLDGGSAQLSVLREILEKLDITGLEWAALSKEDSKHTKGLTLEKLLNSEGKEIVLPKTSPLLKWLQNVRDRAHEAAVTYHRKTRAKKHTRSLLDEVPLIGPKTKKQLLQKYGSFKGIYQAFLETGGVEGNFLNQRQRTSLLSFLEKKKKEESS